jgi:hypothetical protein
MQTAETAVGNSLALFKIPWGFCASLQTNMLGRELKPSVIVPANAGDAPMQAEKKTTEKHASNVLNQEILSSGGYSSSLLKCRWAAASCWALDQPSVAKGKFCTIHGRPVNIESSMSQESVAKTKGKWASRSTVAGVGLVAKLCCRRSGMFPAYRSSPTNHSCRFCRHLVDLPRGQSSGRITAQPEVGQRRSS